MLGNAWSKHRSGDAATVTKERGLDVYLSMPGLRPWERPREAVRQLLCGATVRTCAPVALVVGTVLSLVNQGDVLAMGMGSAALGAKIGVNYLVPFLTSSTGALLAVRGRAPRQSPTPPQP